MNIAVFVSGNGSNLQAIINAVKSKKLKNCRVSLVVSDNGNAFALKRAQKAGIETFVLEPKKFKTRTDYDKVIAAELVKRKIQLVVLAGFMRLLSDYFVDMFNWRIMNIHPSILPSFKGTHAIKDAFLYGVKVTGVTVHFVDKELDHGPIILQKEVVIENGDTLKSLEEKVHKVEHKLYPKAIGLFIKNKLKVEDRVVLIKD